MNIKKRFLSLAVAGVALAAPMTADAAVVKLGVSGSNEFLTYNPTVGFPTMKPTTSATPSQQRWDQIKGPGPTSYFRHVSSGLCMRASASNNAFLRMSTCNFSDNAASREQQWILSAGRLANRARLIAGNPASHAIADFNNINHVVKMGPFDNRNWFSIPA
ncbi:hypothetical protein DVA67_017765 [Solirubrobacter sp. CPCC 204708]|uniref:RICIN domain-containing protein n=1 Tax=Solirubrobacter deserti TaxID=2282478 RepID=A0ABT4RCY2_9ACTN|nr:hypothetical protein [Solirubrobacter deserti]MBE2317834.1 hypothetical protein [Solirubrobacter deserti]MDA0136389.1 RICIN domain-containing protein [Solirubrobacter deserti]